MEIKVTEIGLLHNFAWLIIGSEDDQSRTTVKLNPKQLQDLAQQIISRLKENSRSKRDFYNGMDKDLNQPTDERSK